MCNSRHHQLSRLVRNELQIARLTRNSILQLNSTFSVNWTAGEPFSAGATRTITTRIEPTLTWASLSIVPLVTVTKTTTLLGRSQLTVDTLVESYTGQLSWTMPGHLKFKNTLSVDAGWTRNSDGLIGTGVTTPRLSVSWNLLAGFKK
jgi:hypothetical protein